MVSCLGIETGVVLNSVARVSQCTHKNKLLCKPVESVVENIVLLFEAVDWILRKSEQDAQ